MLAGTRPIFDATECINNETPTVLAYVGPPYGEDDYLG